MWKIIVSLASMFLTDAQLVGSQRDDHGCVMDGGYQWCEPLNQCVRPWVTPCIGPLNNPSNNPGDPVVTTIIATPVSGRTDAPTQSPPADCVSWFDGCNRCVVRDGQMVGCTRMMCVQTQAPRCLLHSVHTSLSNNDVCYRFCEDGSETNVDRRNECPSGTTCASVSASDVVGFDSCGSRALRCVTPH